MSKIFSTTKYKHHHLDEVTAGVVDIVQGVKAEQVSQDFSDRKRALNFREEFSEAANHVLHVISLHKKNEGSRYTCAERAQQKYKDYFYSNNFPHLRCVDQLH